MLEDSNPTRLSAPQEKRFNRFFSHLNRSSPEGVSEDDALEIQEGQGEGMTTPSEGPGQWWSFFGVVHLVRRFIILPFVSYVPKDPDPTNRSDKAAPKDRKGKGTAFQVDVFINISSLVLIFRKSVGGRRNGW